jgi:hypothetical protein
MGSVRVISLIICYADQLVAGYKVAASAEGLLQLEGFPRSPTLLIVGFATMSTLAFYLCIFLLSNNVCYNPCTPLVCVKSSVITNVTTLTLE